jgi:hypothetical protein
MCGGPIQDLSGPHNFNWLEDHIFVFVFENQIISWS